MTVPTEPTTEAPQHAFQLLSKTYPGSTRASWSQAGTGDLTAAEAHAWIDAQLAAVTELGVREIQSAAEREEAAIESPAVGPGTPADAVAGTPVAAGVSPDQLLPPGT